MNEAFRLSCLLAPFLGAVLLGGCKPNAKNPIRFDKLQVTKDEITAIDVGRVTINNTVGPAFLFHGRASKYFAFSANIRDSGDDLTDIEGLIQQIVRLQPENDCSIVVHLITNTYYDTSTFSDSRRYFFFTCIPRGASAPDFLRIGTEAGFASPQISNPMLFWIDDLHRGAPEVQSQLSRHFDVRIPLVIVERTDFHRYVPPPWP